MDLHEVTTLTVPSSRGELLAALGPGAAALGGGTWLLSQPQPGVTGLVDLAGLGWPALTAGGDGLEIAATATLAELAAFAAPAAWTAWSLVRPCCEALAGSPAVRHCATVGGNVCLALPAGPMTSLAAALDGLAVVWGPDGERRQPVAEFVTGDRRTTLAPGEVLRAVVLPARALTARTAFRRASLAPFGRSGAVVTGRRDPDGLVLTVTASVDRPHRVTFDGVPDPATAARAVDDGISGDGGWFDDPHGAPDWRRAVTLRMAREITEEIATEIAAGTAGQPS